MQPSKPVILRWLAAILAILAVALTALPGVAAAEDAPPPETPAPAVRMFTPEELDYLCILSRNDAAMASGWGTRGMNRMSGTPCDPAVLPAIDEAVRRIVPPEWVDGYLQCAQYLAIRESNLWPVAQNRIAGGLFGMHKRYFDLWVGVYNDNFGVANGLPSGGDLLSPADNARVAVFMLLHGGPGPWRPIPRVCRLPHANDFQSLVWAYQASH